MSNNKIWLLSLLVGILIISALSLVSAETYPANLNISFKIPTNLTNCNLTLEYANTTLILNGVSMDNKQGYANYTINSLDVGNYNYYSECKTGIIKITGNGQAASNNLEIFIWMLFIFTVLGNLVFLIMILVKLATSTETIFGVLNAWGFYVLLIITSYLSGFLTYGYITSITNLLLTILVWSNGVLPLISLIITMFIKGTKKKRPMGIQELTGNQPFRRWF